MTDAVTIDFACPIEHVVPGATYTSVCRTLTDWDVSSFATLTGDLHPLRSSASSRRSMMGDRAARGMLLLAFSMGLVPLDATAIAGVRGIAGARFERPASTGDSIRVEVTVEEVRDGGVVACAWRVLNQRDQLLVDATVELGWRTQATLMPVRDEEPVYPVGVLPL